MVEEKLGEERVLIDNLHLYPGQFSQSTKRDVTDDTGNRRIYSDYIETLRGGEGKQKSRYTLDYLVLGYYVNQKQEYSNKRNNHLDIELYEVIVDGPSTGTYAPPRSEKSLY